MWSFPHPAVSFVLILSCGLSACDKHAAVDAPAPAEPSEAQREQVVVQASAAINPFKKKLSEALTGAMSQGGPIAAIDVCSQDARRLAVEASTATVAVGRSALKLRNHNNAPRDWLKPVLSELETLPSAEGAQRVVNIDGQHFGFAEAITLKPPCSVCHGSEVAAPIAAKLKERYPEDQATGFQPGQLRGVFWAEVLLAKQP